MVLALLIRKYCTTTLLCFEKGNDMFGNKQLNKTKIKKISIAFFIRSLNGSTTTPACNSAENDEENISPNKRKRKRKNYFRQLEKQSRTDKTEAQLYFENPSKSLDQLDHYPSIKKIYV